VKAPELLHDPRNHLFWFVYPMFGVELPVFKEVFIDATFGTNSLNAHLFSILGEENGYCIPLAYMLVESRKNEKTNDSNNEMTAMVRNFFVSSHKHGLNPDFVHFDKCFSEITASQVCLLYFCYNFVVEQGCVLIFSRVALFLALQQGTRGQI
jgi:hypothetical protein